MNLILGRLGEKVKQGFLSYSLGLILTEGKSTCTKIASLFGIKHDFLYRFLSKANLFIPIFPELMFAIVNEFNRQKKGWLIIDDTVLSKRFAKMLEGVYSVYNSALGRSEKGFTLVVIAWSNGQVTIPLKFLCHFHKNLVGETYKTKSKLAKQLVLDCKDKASFSHLLIDGHYTTNFLMNALIKHDIKFVGKFPKNRVIKTKNGERTQVSKHSNLKLMRNKRSKQIRAEFAGMLLHFSVHKQKKRDGQFTFTYIVSNINTEPKQYLFMYKQRWSIETMFRTMKQSLGLSQCASRDLQKQYVHIYSVFFSYSFLQEVKLSYFLKNPETAAKCLSQRNIHTLMSRITSFSRNFGYVA